MAYDCWQVLNKELLRRSWLGFAGKSARATLNHKIHAVHANFRLAA